MNSTCSYYHYSYYCCFVLEFSLKMCCTFTVINGSHIHWIFQPGTYASDLLFREESIVQLQSFPYGTSSFPIMHLICPPKFCINIVFNFFWDGCNTQENKKQRLPGMQNLGANKVHYIYGKCGSGVKPTYLTLYGKVRYFCSPCC